MQKTHSMHQHRATDTFL